jgi:hypothetical protein
MSLQNIVGISDAQEHALFRALQLAMLGLLVYGVVTLQGDIIVPVVIALSVTALPAILRREYGYSMDIGLVLWVTIAAVLHMIGSIGVYERFQWYDEVTHIISATVVAGVGYAALRALELHTNEIDVPGNFRAVFILVFVLATAVVWEIFEFALGDYVTVYGIDDIVTDMIANTVGAILMAMWGTSYVSGLIGFFSNRLRSNSEM